MKKRRDINDCVIKCKDDIKENTANVVLKCESGRYIYNLNLECFRKMSLEVGEEYDFNINTKSSGTVLIGCKEMNGDRIFYKIVEKQTKELTLKFNKNKVSITIDRIENDLYTIPTSIYLFIEFTEPGDLVEVEGKMIYKNKRIKRNDTGIIKFKTSNFNISIEEDGNRIKKASDDEELVYCKLDINGNSGIYHFLFEIDNKNQRSIQLGFLNCDIQSFEGYDISEKGIIHIVCNIEKEKSTMSILKDDILYQICKSESPVIPSIGLSYKDDSVSLLDYYLDSTNSGLFYFNQVDKIYGMKSINSSSYINVIIQCLMCNKQFEEEMLKTNVSIPDMAIFDVNYLASYITYYFSTLQKKRTYYLYEKLEMVVEVINEYDIDLHELNPITFLFYLQQNLISEEIKKYSICEYNKENNYTCETEYVVIYNISFLYVYSQLLSLILLQICNNKQLSDRLYISSNTYKLQCLVVYMILFNIYIVFNVRIR